MAITQAQLEAMDADTLRALVATMAKARETKLTLKVTDKGGVSLYGLGRFPVTLYKSQWERLLNGKDDILAFIEANGDRLSLGKAAAS